VNVEQHPILDGFRNKIPNGKHLRIIFRKSVDLSENAVQANQNYRQMANGWWIWWV